MSTKVDSCRACGGPKFIPTPGAMAVCEMCDRRKCGNCKTPVRDGKTNRCPHCWRPFGIL